MDTSRDNAMQTQRLVGPESGVLKYDILTALSVAGLASAPGFCTTLMRLIALITARYNWREDEFTVGQRDMARMWSVDERTVKRQIKRLIDAEIVVCKRPGVRGRVGAYRLNQSGIVRLSKPSWHLVGPDFERRMQERYLAEEVKVVRMSGYKQQNIMPDKSLTPMLETKWGRSMTNLAQMDKAQFDAWFARLKFIACEDGCLRLQCASTFIQRYIETHLMTRLLNATEAEFGKLNKVQFE